MLDCYSNEEEDDDDDDDEKCDDDGYINFETFHEALIWLARKNTCTKYWRAVCNNLILNPH